MTVPDKPHFTTAEVARLCGFGEEVVAKMFDRGDLKGHRSPGPGPRTTRRIDRASVVALVEGLGLGDASLKLDFDLNEIERSK